MKTSRTAGALAASALVALLLAGLPAAAHQPGSDGSSGTPGTTGYGPGMMGGYGQGYGPGMMGGYGPGMMGGYGQGYGPGMMGGGGQGYGPGMMGGYGAGMMGYGPCANGPGAAAAAVDRDLSVDDVRSFLTRRLAAAGNPNVKVGAVTEESADTIQADIVTTDKDGLVQRWIVDRHSGIWQPAN